MSDDPQNPQNPQDGGRPAPMPQQPAPDGHSGGGRYVTLRRPVLVLLVVGIVAALFAGYAVGRLTIISQANAVIAQKNSKIEKLNTSLDSVRKQLTDANAGNSTDEKGNGEDGGTQQGQIGQTVTNGGIEMKLVSAGEQSTISYDTCGDGCSNGEYAPKNPDANTKYWVATVEVKNNTRKPLDISCGYPYEIIALNSESQQYTPIQDIYQVQGNPECNAQLQPGLDTRVTYPFQVPLDAKMVAIAFRDVGDLTTGTGGSEDYSYLVAEKGYKITAGR